MPVATVQSLNQDGSEIIHCICAVKKYSWTTQQTMAGVDKSGFSILSYLDQFSTNFTHFIIR